MKMIDVPLTSSVALKTNEVFSLALCGCLDPADTVHKCNLTRNWCKFHQFFCSLKTYQQFSFRCVGIKVFDARYVANHVPGGGERSMLVYLPFLNTISAARTFYKWDCQQ